jgi:hypothetical protein
MAKKKQEEVRFTFLDGDYTGAVVGKTECGICYGRFIMPEVGTQLHDFFICPSCVLSGLAAVATETEKTIGDKKRLERWSKYPDEQQGIAEQYRALIRRLRRVKSFKEIRGGEIALAIAAATAGNGSRPDEWTYTITRAPRARGKAA